MCCAQLEVQVTGLTHNLEKRPLRYGRGDFLLEIMDYRLDLAVRLQQKRIFRGCGTAPVEMVERSLF
jgi:hypothetical protein